MSISTFAQDNSKKKHEDVTFASVQNPVIFPGCEKDADKRKCFSTSISKYVGNNFRRPKDLKDGQIKMLALFTINYEGKITNIHVRAKHKVLREELKRVIESLPTMIPASQNNKKVNIMFQMPIVFKN